MSESATGQLQPGGKGRNPDPRDGEGGTDSLLNELRRLSRFSADLEQYLSGVVLGIRKTVDELAAVEKTIRQKKAELNEINGAGRSASVLADLVEEHLKRKAEFERLMEDQRRLWNEERAKRERKEAEYRDALKLRRQREEEEYRKSQAEEERLARRRLEEDLRQMQQQNLERQELLQGELLKREQSLKQKEAEWERLAGELELFMNRLLDRTRKDLTGAESAPREVKPDPAESGIPDSMSAEPEKDLPENRTPGTDISPEADPEPSFEAIKEMLLAQERRIENIHSSLKRNLSPDSGEES